MGFKVHTRHGRVLPRRTAVRRGGWKGPGFGAPESPALREAAGLREKLVSNTNRSPPDAFLRSLFTFHCVLLLQIKKKKNPKNPPKPKKSNRLDSLIQVVSFSADHECICVWVHCTHGHIRIILLHEGFSHKQ